MYHAFHVPADHCADSETFPGACGGGCVRDATWWEVEVPECLAVALVSMRMLDVRGVVRSRNVQARSSRIRSEFLRRRPAALVVVTLVASRPPTVPTLCATALLQPLPSRIFVPRLRASRTGHLFVRTFVQNAKHALPAPWSSRS